MQSAEGAGANASVGDGGERVASKVGGIVSEVKTAAGEMAGGVKDKAVSSVNERKGTAVQTLGSVAGALRAAATDLRQGEGSGLGTYADSAAEQIDKVAGYLREKDLTGLTRDAETFARRHPEVFLGGAFLAGIFAARFLKSSRPRPATPEGGFEAGFGGGYASGPQSYAGGAQTEPFNPPHFDSTGGE